MLKFDRALFAIYCLTALLPIYALFARESERLFHAMGALLIVAVGVAGAAVDNRVLRGEVRTERAAYLVTLGFIVSRVILGVWAVWITHARLMGSIAREAFGSSQATTSASLWESVGTALEAILSPALVWVLLPVAFYRVLYHISVHFLLKIQKMDTEPNKPVQINPVNAPRKSGGVTAIPVSPRRV